MDIENSEWASLRYMAEHNLLKDIQQIGVEIHLMDFTRMKTLEEVS